MRYITVTDEDKELLLNLAGLLAKASFNIDAKEVMKASQVLVGISKLAERVRTAQEFPEPTTTKKAAK